MHTDGDFTWEEGANSFQPNEVILTVARDLGLLSDLVLADSNLPRYIYWNNSLQPLPVSLQQLFETRLLTLRGKIAFILGALGLVGPEGGQGEESIEEFATRHFGVHFIFTSSLVYFVCIAILLTISCIVRCNAGKEVFSRIVDPFVSGVYAGDPKALSMRSALKKVMTHTINCFLNNSPSSP